jgi:RNA polymerase sigma factor (sigma-70 family)
MTAEQGRWRRLIDGLRVGDQRVAQEFWEQYGKLLHQVAQQHLAEGLRRRVGPEDVVQSACRTFLRRAKEGEFQLADSAALWSLLCAITLTKIRELTRYHLRRKRGLNREAHLAAGSEDSGTGNAGPAAPGPSPAEAAEFADQFQQLLASLDAEERQIVELKLQDYTHEEVAQQLGCSERTVRRIVKRVQARLAGAFGVSPEPS